ncbi:unnamed protein product [Amoebophrya sp. A25]|nr:unnamed protein product [Amoebophrya sp. A25]|eukprot:GSA25T00001467001.1
MDPSLGQSGYGGSSSSSRPDGEEGTPTPRGDTATPPAALIKTTDPQAVFFTDCFNDSKRLWEIYYMTEIVKGIQALVDKELEGEEHGFLMLFMKFDLDMSGTLSVDEICDMLTEYGVERKAQARTLAQSILEHTATSREEAARSPNGRATTAADPVSYDAVEFVDYLRWFSNNKNHEAFKEVGFKFADFGAQLIGTRHIAPVGDRLRTLPREQLRRAIVNYRALYRSLRVYKSEEAMRSLPDDAVEEVKTLYNLIAKELSMENEALFNLFAEFDEDLDGKLNKTEQAKMFRGFDQTATDNEVQIYLREVNAEPHLHLQFLDFLDWWEQSKMVPQSLVSRKKLGKALQSKLTTSMSTVSTISQGWLYKIGGDSLFGNVFGHPLRKKWESLDVEDLLRLCEVYKILYVDLRNYTLEHEIAQLEAGIVRAILV